jgi:sugar phosphate isomerase/epimerase
MHLSVTISGTIAKTAPFLLQGDYAAQVETAAALGYRWVELHVQDPKTIDRGSLFRALEATGLKVSSLGTGQAYSAERIFLSAPDGSVRRVAVERIKAQLDLAADLNALVIIGMIRGPLPADPAQAPTAEARILEALRQCAEYAESLGGCLVLEAINRYESNFLNTAAQTVEFIQRAGSSALGLHLDTYHMNIEERHPAAAIREFGPCLRHVHLADNTRWAPGMGYLDFAELLGALRETGYSGALAVECLPLPTGLEAARQALEHIGPLLEGN